MQFNKKWRKCKIITLHVNCQQINSDNNKEAFFSFLIFTLIGNRVQPYNRNLEHFQDEEHYTYVQQK